MAASPPAQARYAGLMEQLAEATTQFGQNVLHDEAGYQLRLQGEADLAGLPDFVRDAARQAALERGLADAHVITLSRSLIVPFLSFSERRDLREQAWRAWVGRGAHPGAQDNRPVAQQILALRQRQAVLMGGTSSEREVSLDSGRNVLEALQARGVDAHAVDGIPALVDALVREALAQMDAPAQLVQKLTRVAPPRPIVPGEALTVVSWNLQFAAGTRHHFFYDGGQAVFVPPTRCAPCRVPPTCTGWSGATSGSKQISLRCSTAARITPPCWQRWRMPAAATPGACAT